MTDLPAHLLIGQELSFACEVVTNVLFDHADELDSEERARVLDAIRTARAELDATYRDVEQELVATAGEKRFVVDGLGEVEIRKSIKRTQWDHDGLTRRVVALALDERIADEQTGEYEPAYEAVARVLAECARPTWRVTPLRARGIQVDEFCSEDPDGFSVMLPKHKVEA